VVEFQWFRAFVGSFSLIDGVHGDSYTTTANDVGAVLRACCINSAGQSAQAKIGPVNLPEKLAFSLHDLLTTKKIVGFATSLLSSGATLPITGKGKEEQLTLLLTKDKLKLRSGRRTLQKAEFNPSVAFPCC
jgi:hypothetical protein